MRCPLPIDWLEYVEGAHPRELDLHLAECRPCQLLVEKLQREGRPSLQPWRVDRPVSWPHWRDTHSTSPAFGEMWWSVSSLGSPPKTAARVLLLIVSDPWKEGGRSWCEVVPLSSDIENATSLDLMLLRGDTDANVPWRAFLRQQTVVERAALDARIGSLTDEGRVIVRNVLAGHGPENRFGSPIDGPQDPRARIPEEIDRTILLLGQAYAHMLEQGEVIAKPSRIRSSEMQRSVRPGIALRELSLAASTDAEQEERAWTVEIPQRGRIQGRIEHRYCDDELLFVVEEVIEEERGLRTAAWIVVWSGHLTVPVTSQAFIPAIDEKIVIGRDLGIFPREINRVELRLSDED